MKKSWIFTVVAIFSFLSISWAEAAKLLPGLKENSKVTIELENDEVAIFGYGSLMFLEELENQPYNGPFIEAELCGFKRTWSARYPNWRPYSYSNEDEDYFIPASITFLNIEPCTNCKVNGMIFICSKEDLESYDTREGAYNRININDNLLDVSIIGGNAYAYTAKPENYFPTNQNTSPEDTVISESYVEIIKEVLDIMGKEFAIEYRNSSQPLPRQLVYFLE